MMSGFGSCLTTSRVVGYMVPWYVPIKLPEQLDHAFQNCLLVAALYVVIWGDSANTGYMK